MHSLSTAEFIGQGLPDEVRAGHIPGSINVPWHTFIDDRTGRYLTPSALADFFDAAGIDAGQDIITYCGGGIAASMTAFALALTGHHRTRVYDGSLAEWSDDPALPLIRQ